MKNVLFSIGFLLMLSCNSKQSAKNEQHQESPIQLKVAAYNVEVSRNATAEEIGNALKSYDFDVVCFSEAPGGDWTKEVAGVMGLTYVTVGKYTTAGHEDKYKTIASRTPLFDVEEILMADTLHTVTKAMTKISDKEIGIYSVHFPFGWRDQAHIDETTGKVIAFVDYLKKLHGEEVSVVMGDFNFIPTNPEKISPYHELFVELGLDVHWKGLGIDATKINTHNALKPEDEGNGKVIDHVMYEAASWKVLDGGIVEMERQLSDHKAVWVLLEFK